MKGIRYFERSKELYKNLKTKDSNILEGLVKCCEGNFWKRALLRLNFFEGSIKYNVAKDILEHRKRFGIDYCD